MLLVGSANFSLIRTMRATTSKKHCREHVGELRNDIHRDVKIYAAYPSILGEIGIRKLPVAVQYSDLVVTGTPPFF